MNILEVIAGLAKERVEEKKKIISFEKIKEMALKKTRGEFEFENALRSREMSFICEVKKASPSKGVIAQSFPYISIAKDYEAAGASAISVLTEPHYFLGRDKFLEEISCAVKTPLLRKDFTVDSYMIYEAKLLGASAVLLICSLLNKKILAEYIEIAESLGLSALVEVHDQEETEMALAAGARIIGVNNRNLKTFEVDISLSERLREGVPKDILFVAESGIQSSDDIIRLQKIGADAVLIGESIMRSSDKKAAIKGLRGLSIG